MKALHRPDLFAWSQFNPDRNLDFHGYLWVRDAGNLAVDPVPLSEHDQAELRALGGLATIIITNSDHVRAAAELAELTSARVLGPAAERGGFPIKCDGWLVDGDEPLPGLRVLALEGSKTPGELALVLERTTLITGDLVRCHAGGTLCMLPDPKLSDRAKAVASVRRLAELQDIEAVLVGDGWPLFHGGAEALAAIT